MWIHQIKVPLASLRLMVQSAEANALPEPLRRDIKQQLFAVEQYTNMVLQYQNLQQDTHDLAFGKFSYQTLVNTAAKRVSSLFIAGNVTLEIAPLPGHIITDEKWFVMILEQLLSNGAKYTPNGKVRVYLKNHSTLCIQDTGIGIKNSDLPRQFERSFTGNNGHKERYSTGIGLYLCSKAAHLLHLTLTVESALSQGTTVSILHQQTSS